MTNVVGDLIEAVKHQQQGRVAAAEAIYREVLMVEPEQPNALYLYGMLQLKDGRAASAAMLLGRAAQLRNDADVLLHLARAQLASGKPEAAVRSAQAVLAKGESRAEALYLHGTALNACGRPEEALFSLTEAAAHAPGHAATRLNAGNALADLDRLDEAEAHIRTALALDPAMIEAYVSLAFVLISLGKLDEAASVCEAAITLDPGCGDAHWNLAKALLLAGDFARGFTEYEWRKQHTQFRKYFRQLSGPAWEGGPLDGLTLLVHAEQGLGDTIQLARYLPILAARGAIVVLACAAPLLPLMQGQPGVADVVNRDHTLPAYDLWVDQMSLPRLLGTTRDAVPGGPRYLHADPARRGAWAKRPAGRRIGFAWAGNPLHSNDARRSLPLHAAKGLATPGMISLQVGSRAHEAASLGLEDPSAELTDYAETAALISTLDLVVTVDTSIAHLAGALGVPVWVMLPHAPDWRWILGRDDSPWYPTMRLFRQSMPGDWNGVVGRIHNALADVGL